MATRTCESCVTTCELCIYQTTSLVGKLASLVILCLLWNTTWKGEGDLVWLFPEALGFVSGNSQTRLRTNPPWATGLKIYFEIPPCKKKKNLC